MVKTKNNNNKDKHTGKFIKTKGSYYKKKKKTFIYNNGKKKGIYKKRKINTKLNAFNVFNLSKRKRIFKINKYLVYGIRSHSKWGHKTYFKLANLKINKIKSPIYNKVLNKKSSSNFIAAKKLTYKSITKLSCRINNEIANIIYRKNLKNILYKRNIRLNRKVTKRNKVFKALNTLKNELELKEPVYLINEKIKKNPEVIIKHENGNKIAVEKKILQAYSFKNYIKHKLKKKLINTSTSLDNKIFSNFDNKFEKGFDNLELLVQKIYNIKDYSKLYNKSLLNKFYNWNLNIKKRKALSLKFFITKNQKNFIIKTGIKNLFKIYFLANVLKNLKQNLIEEKEIQEDFTSALNLDLNSKSKIEESIKSLNLINLQKKTKKSRRKFVLSRIGLYSLWNNKIYLKKRYYKLITQRGMKNVKTILSILQKEVKKSLRNKQQSYERKVAVLREMQNTKMGAILDEVRIARRNMKYFMKIKIKRRKKVFADLKQFRSKGYKKVTKKERQKAKKKVVNKQRNKEFQELKLQHLKQKVIRTNKEAIINAITTKKSNEIKNEIVVKLILQLLKNKGEENLENSNRTIENLMKYMKKNENVFENINIVTYIKAKLINEYLEKRELTKLKELNKQLIIQYMEYTSIKLPKERLPVNEFKELMSQYYTEKNKFTQIKKEMKKNLVYYHLYNEKIKDNNKVYQIKLPKKRIVVPSLRTIYQGLKQAIKVQKRKMKIRRYGKDYFKRKNKKKRRYNKYQKELRKQKREKIKRKKQLLKLKRKKPEIPKLGILKIKLKKRNMFLILCNRTTNKIEEQATAREIYYKISEARNDVKPELGKKINRRKTAIKDKGPIGRHISTAHFRLFILSLLFLYRARYKILDVEIEKRSRKKIVRIIRRKYWYPFLAQLGVFRRFKYIKNKPHGRMRKRKTKRR